MMGMARPCSTCQHVKRPEIDRRLAAGEPSKQIARDYGLNPSSLHRHRINCIGLASSKDVMKEAARITAALQVTVDVSVNVTAAVQAVIAAIGLNPSHHVIAKLEKIVDAD
jgi:hypothetical protein